MSELGSFTFYQPDPSFYIFRCYGPQQGQLGVHSVEPSGLHANIEALERMGYVNRTARREHLNFRTWEWEGASGISTNAETTRSTEREVGEDQ